MENLTTEELRSKLASIEHELELLQQRGANDEKLVSEKKDILRILYKDYFKNDNNHERIL